MRVALIGAPSNAGSRSAGLEEAPSALRTAGLVEALRAAGADVVDLGDVARVSAGADPEHPRARNLARVAEVAHGVAGAVRGAARDGRKVLVLGGDCSVSLGVVAGLRQQPRDLGLLYVDGDLDLNTPDTTPSGFFDGMVAAHLLGGGRPELSGLGSRCPLLEEESLAFFGYNTGSGFVDPPELQAFARCRSPRYAVEQVRADPAGTARQAIADLRRRAERLLVHFDVDATDLPAADLPHPGALPWGAAVEALREAARDPAWAGLVLTELNPRRDRGGSSLRRVVEALAELAAAS